MTALSPTASARASNQAITIVEDHPLRRSAVQHVELLPKKKDFGPQGSLRPEQSDYGKPDQPAEIAHRGKVSADSQAVVSRFGFAVGTASRQSGALMNS